ncbi:methyltransferase domain-containing protein [Streptomyces sp. TRM72054]|nr:methyltransferase domain-containing protein [Streptomyces sp. TRM72054]
MERGALTSDWAPAFAAVDRASFLPYVMWPYDMVTGQTVTVDRREDPDAWFVHADRDNPIVTQWDDGRHTGRRPGTVSTSSSSMPSVVYKLLADLDAAPGMAVLDVGTGTGETAGLLTYRCGPRGVTTIDIDRAVSSQARKRLRAVGLPAEAVVGDGFQGYRENAPYDRILATCGLRVVPGAWLEQTRPGGLVLAPWGTDFSPRDAVARLTVARDGTASGHFVRLVEFMKLRTQRFVWPDHDSYVSGDWAEAADRSATTAVEVITAGRFDVLPFAVGLRVAACAHTAYEQGDGSRAAWFYSLTADRSWAAVSVEPGVGEAVVYQWGSRRLWDEVEIAYRWWEDRGRPHVDRFGLTVTPEGHRAWLDTPADSWPVEGSAGCTTNP